MKKEEKVEKVEKVKEVKKAKTETKAAKTETKATKTETKKSNKGLMFTLIAVVVIIAAVVVGLVIAYECEVFGGKDISGKYELVAMKNGETEYSEDYIRKIKAFGVNITNVTLELYEDKTGVINISGKEMQLTYNKKTMTYSEQEAPYTVEGDKITITSNDTSMTFQKVVVEETPAEVTE